MFSIGYKVSECWGARIGVKNLFLDRKGKRACAYACAPVRVGYLNKIVKG